MRFFYVNFLYTEYRSISVCARPYVFRKMSLCRLTLAIKACRTCMRRRSCLKRKKQSTLSEEQKAHNRALSLKRVSVEHVFAQLKKFKNLGSTYRKFRKKLHLRFNVIAGIYKLLFSYASFANFVYSLSILDNARVGFS